MIGCFWTCVSKQPIIALYYESETVLKFYNLEARNRYNQAPHLTQDTNGKVTIRHHKREPRGQPFSA